MPFIHIKLAGMDLTDTQRLALQAGMTDRMARLMAKQAELTAVLVERLDVSGWSIGAAPVPVAAHVDAFVTAGTNDEKQKLAFIGNVHDLLRELCGAGLPLATYVIVHEVPASDWGYGGQTQAARRNGWKAEDGNNPNAFTP